MKSKMVIFLSWIILASLPVLGQEKIYPVRGSNDNPVLLAADRSAVVVEKAFQHKLTLGFPTDDRTEILPDTRTPLVVLWLRIQNLSQRPFDFSIAKFTSTDDEGRTYSAWLPDEAFNRMMADASDGSIGSRTLRGISLGRVGSKRTVDEVKDDIVRYSLHPGQIPPGGTREGLIYFEGPRRKKFTVGISLGDLWSKPLVFSTEKR
jgi:hypothetical protein